MAEIVIFQGGNSFDWLFMVGVEIKGVLDSSLVRVAYITIQRQWGQWPKIGKMAIGVIFKGNNSLQAI